MIPQQAPEPESLCSDPSSVTYLLWSLRPVPLPLWATWKEGIFNTSKDGMENTENKEPHELGSESWLCSVLTGQTLPP